MENNHDQNSQTQIIHPKSKVAITAIGLILLLSLVDISKKTPETYTKPNYKEQAQVVHIFDNLKNTLQENSRSFNLFTIPSYNELRLNAKIINPIFPQKDVKLTPKITPIVTVPQKITPTPKPISTLLENIPIKSTVSDPKTSVVHILCTINEGSRVKYISSTGFVISKSGLILTNAHVGIHPFLDTYTNTPVSCRAKIGSPSSSELGIELIYISPRWTSKHKGEIDGSFSLDNGEYDVAILKTTSDISKYGINPAQITLNNNLSVSSENIGLAKHSIVTLVGYPINGKPSSLQKKVEQLEIEDTYPIGTKGTLIETSVSTEGKSGASGSPLFGIQNQVVGMAANIVNSSSKNGTKIHAIDVKHINETLYEDTGLDLLSLTGGYGLNLKQVFESKFKESVQSDLLK